LHFGIFAIVVVVVATEPNSEYVISLRAYNNVGDGRPIYETTRTRDEEAEVNTKIIFYLHHFSDPCTKNMCIFIE
jgi:hypothetical protein